MESGNKVRIVKSDLLDAETNVICVAFMGAPAMLAEKLMNGSELLGVVEQMEQHLKIKEKNEKTALICGEIGGCNGLTPIIAAAQFAEKNGKTIDLVDADFMGRAFPELQMISKQTSDAQSNFKMSQKHSEKSQIDITVIPK